MRVFAALALIATGSLQAGTGSDVDAIVDAAAAYVRQYQEQLTSVVADEIYTQQVKAQVPLDRGMPPSRTLRSEIFFMFAPGHQWMAIRDVRQVDRRPVGDRPDLREALMTLPAVQVARQFKAYNSRFNLGRVSRNFNEPTLSLLVLDDRHRARFAFTRVRTQQVRGRHLVTVGFRERRGPTLIFNLQGDPVFSSGEITVEPSSGRITRATLSLTIDTVRITLTTTYGEDTRLGIWVPVRFGEHYVDGSKKGPYFEEIVCEARYTNFHQFEVRTRIR